MKGKEYRNCHGITLMALVVTIIILMILAGVTIASLTGQKGIIKEARTAKEMTEKAALEEQVELAIIKAEQKHSNPTIDNIIEELKNSKVISNDDQVNKETGAIRTDLGYEIIGKLDDYIGKVSIGDGNTTGGGDIPPMPSITLPSTENTKPFVIQGATIINDDLNTGLVLKDSNDNEWVWVEVPKSIYTTVTSSKDYTNIEKNMRTYANDYGSNAYSDTWYDYNNIEEEKYNELKQKMLESVYKNGGFYIGRYELGTSIALTSIDSTYSRMPIMKEGAYPYPCRTAKDAQALCEKMETGNNTCAIPFGIQWSLMMKFIEVKGIKTKSQLLTDSSSWANYNFSSFSTPKGRYIEIDKSGAQWSATEGFTKSSSKKYVHTSGCYETNCVMGIYDLAGNLSEWTLECDSTWGAVHRGGSADHNYIRVEAVSGRATGTGYYALSVGCRPSLY